MPESTSDPRRGDGRRAIALLARWPRPGHVKRRLSPALPPAEACRLYEAMLADAAAAAGGCGAERAFLYWADAPENEREWLRVAPALEPRRQYGAGPGARLRDAFVALLERPGDRAVIIGTGCPLLGAGAIRHAFATLDSAEAVLGPTRDGSCYLIGLTAPTPALFEDITWGTGRVFEQMLKRAEAARLRVAQLEPLDVLGTPEDLVRLLVRAVSPPPLPGLQTLETLRAFGLLPAAEAV